MTELELVKKILEGNPDLEPKIPVASITPETRFREDLGFDSLAMVSLLYELQETLPHLEETVIIKWNKISDCIQSMKNI